jgi:hypothetical protein
MLRSVVAARYCSRYKSDRDIGIILLELKVVYVLAIEVEDRRRPASGLTSAYVWSVV